MTEWFGLVVARLGDIVLGAENFIIEWLGKLRSSKTFVGILIVVGYFVLMGVILSLVKTYPEAVESCSTIVTTIVITTGGFVTIVVSYFYKLRKDERLNGNRISNNINEVASKVGDEADADSS